MKLIRQTQLHFREGTSDKVYEVDLCESGEGRYVVNFRFGKRGANLKEGTKTTSPVALDQAEQIYNALVSEKTKKGYREIGAQKAAESTTPAKPRAAFDAAARQAAILRALQEAAELIARKKKPPKTKWPLERTIWRAGELSLSEAAPALTAMIGSGDALRDYCLAWALGRCGNALVIPALKPLLEDEKRPDFVRRMAREAIRRLLPAEARPAFMTEMLEALPSSLRELIRQGSPEIFAQALRPFLEGGDHRRAETLYQLYLIDNDFVRPALLGVLRHAPLRPGYFKSIRHIFKAAEFRRDAEVFGLIAWRFETEREMFRNPWSWGSVYVDGEYLKPDQEIKKPDSRIAYGSETRVFLRKRVWRTLRRLGQINDPDFVRMAVGALLPFSDADARPPRQSQVYTWRWDQAARRSFQELLREGRWDEYAGYFAFNHLLYGNSSRYELRKGTLSFRCRAHYKPGDAAPAEREESFKHLWNENPVGLVHLLAESNCRPVHQFAVRALRECQEFCQQLDTEIIVTLLGRPYDITAQLGFELAQTRYDASSPDKSLVLAVAHCNYAEARLAACRWISEAREHFLPDNDFLLSFITSRHADTREAARTLLLSASLPEEQSRHLISRLIAFVVSLRAEQAAQAKDVAETLLRVFSQPLRRIGLNVVTDLLNHELLEVQQLGASLLLNHETPASQLPDQVITSLMNSPYESLRGIGIRLFGELSDDLLLNREGVLLSLTLHPLEDVRNASRSIIRRLCQNPQHAQFATLLGSLLLETLWRREPHAGVHEHLTRLLREDIAGDWKAEADQETLLRLINARSKAAQDFGGWLLREKLEEMAPQFTTRNLIKLASHEIKSVRDAGQRLFEKNLSRYRRATNPAGFEAEMATAARLLEAKWDDAREFYFQAFRTQFSADEFTPAILVSICDSVHPQVQAFGRELITRYFTEEAGEEYLLKLSEHPTAELQQFATNYLERYAADHPARLQAMRHYFVSVLSRVNRARVAKDRVLRFLAAEARKSEQAALIVAEILTRQSVTMAIGDKAATIETMLEIRRQYPEIELPIRSVGVNHAV